MIKKTFDHLDRWCNAHHGILQFLGIIVMITIFFLSNIKIDLGNALTSINTFLNLKIQLPLYCFLAVAIVTIIYYRTLRNRYKKRKITPSFLVGIWINEGKKNEPDEGSEQFEVKEDGSYIRNGEHIFNIENFNYNFKKNQIS